MRTTPVPCTDRAQVGVYNVFACPPLLGGATALTRLSLNAVVAVEGAAALPAAAALTSLTFTHAGGCLGGCMGGWVGPNAPSLHRLRASSKATLAAARAANATVRYGNA